MRLLRTVVRLQTFSIQNRYVPQNWLECLLCVGGIRMQSGESSAPGCQTAPQTSFYRMRSKLLARKLFIEEAIIFDRTIHPSIWKACEPTASTVTLVWRIRLCDIEGIGSTWP